MLKRYPHRKRETLQAWDSADELILQHLGLLDLTDRRILVVNDQFGALSSRLERFDLTTYTDSYVSFKGIQLNSQGRVTPVSRLQDLTGNYDLVVIKIPKNMAFFEDILCQLSHHLHSDSQLICGSMVKYLAKASFQLLDKVIGATTTSLAQKKARLVFARFERAPSQSPYPLSVPIEPFETPFMNHSNLFSARTLDIGTRFMLSHIPEGDYQNILDLGCANGVLGIAAAQLNPSASLTFSDESWMAVESARSNFAEFFPDRSAKFLWNHCYEDQEPGSLDLVLCNPPFHQGGSLSDSIARQMFTDARHALMPGGQLRIVGNSHLRYPGMLKQIFGNSEIVDANDKFTIVDAFK